MAEEQVMSQALVLSNDYDKMVEKILNKRLDEKIREFSRMFSIVSSKFFGFNEGQLKEFSVNDLKALDKLICRKAMPWAICQMIFTFGVPIFGWIFAVQGFAEEEYCSWLYLCKRKYLQKIYGKDFFPFDELKQVLQQKS